MRSFDYFLLGLVTTLAILYVDLYYRVPLQEVPGRDGLNGTDGRNGWNGAAGKDGKNGKDGTDGRDGRDGLPGRDGIQGLQGEKGKSGPQGPPGPKSGGATYIRWGNSSCPNTPGTKQVYLGRAAGSRFSERGGGAPKICLPDEPQYHLEESSIPSAFSVLHGSEYETASGPLQELYNENVPCTMCYTSLRNTAVMIPARVYCPPDWTMEYNGYLMTEYGGHQRSSIDCIDIKPGKINGGGKDTNGTLFYHYIVDEQCNDNGLQCPPYKKKQPIACVVCTK